ncbi:MAG: hypothetical protein HYX48_07910 [Chlamydiales bacterium]|nr:hypothetical protein [Chlamydiales bacterium]
MSSIHIANTQFEWELSQTGVPELLATLEKNPVYLQLQFLPFLYAEKTGGVAVSSSPPEEFWRALKKMGIDPPKIHLLSEKELSSYSQLESWGASRSVEAWARSRHLAYSMPDWEVVKRVNSKLFSSSNSPQLPGSKLLNNEEEVASWLNTGSGMKVFKTCFGVSGKGHLLWDPENPPEKERLVSFLTREWQAERVVIGEPWVHRLLDFSTQWKIDSGIHYLGATICETDAKGVHKRNIAGDEQQLFAGREDCIRDHKKVALPILKEMQQLGYFGHVGVDAMLYRRDEREHLHPVVEINARKTMGWAALEIQRRHFPNQLLSLAFLPHASAASLLPTSLITSRNKEIQFSRSLSLSFSSKLSLLKKI